MLVEKVGYLANLVWNSVFENVRQGSSVSQYFITDLHFLLISHYQIMKN